MKGYIFLSVQSNIEKDNISFMMIKTNLDFVVMDKMSANTNEIDAIERMATWIGDPTQYRFVANSLEEFNRFTNATHPYNHKLPRDFLRIIKSRFWNIQNEMSYRLKCPNYFGMDDFLGLYGISSITAGDPMLTNCLQLYALTNAFHTDKKMANEILRNGYQMVLRDRFKLMSYDVLFNQVLSEYGNLVFHKKNAQTYSVEALLGSGVRIASEGESPKSVLIELLMKKYEKN